MGGAEMINKKAAATMTGVFLTILVTMGLFYGMYTYVNNNYIEAGITDTSGYNQSYADLQTSQFNLNTSVLELQEKGQKIAEADAGILYIAWTGLTGLAKAITVFFDVISVGINVFDAIIPSLSFLPPWVKTLVSIGLVITIVLLIIAAFKGENKL